MTLIDIEDPIERFVEFIIERESIRLRRERGDPPPWTENTILQQYRFTNINRENDKVSLHYQKSIRNHYGDDSIVFPATVAYRWFNRISTCDALFNEPDLGNRSYFEIYLETEDIQVLKECIGRLKPPYVTGSYIITGKPGYAKEQGVIEYIHQWCKKPWRTQWEQWKDNLPLLSDMYEWVSSEGLGSFMKGQIIADLKYVPFMMTAQDWWIWATPGPGSLRGLNIVYDKPMDQPWPKDEWLTQLIILSDVVNPLLGKRGIYRLHNQDLQNCLCEWSKYTKTACGLGRPRQVFRGGHL
jgi:hypothetical protein